MAKSSPTPSTDRSHRHTQHQAAAAMITLAHPTSPHPRTTSSLMGRTPRSRPRTRATASPRPSRGPTTGTAGWRPPKRAMSGPLRGAGLSPLLLSRVMGKKVMVMRVALGGRPMVARLLLTRRLHLLTDALLIISSHRRARIMRIGLVTMRLKSPSLRGSRDLRIMRLRSPDMRLGAMSREAMRKHTVDPNMVVRVILILMKRRRNADTTTTTTSTMMNDKVMSC